MGILESTSEAVLNRQIEAQKAIEGSSLGEAESAVLHSISEAASRPGLSADDLNTLSLAVARLKYGPDGGTTYLINTEKETGFK